MTINNNRISVAELDFDAIKANLKTYLKGQETFTGYDFEGSNISMLLDVLAYNTHYRALYDNFILNEMFLDSASKRASVVSRAKELGYTPTSIKSASAYINFTLANVVNGPDVLVISKYTPFIATINGVTYTFITTSTYTAPSEGGTYTIENMKITQGARIVNRIAVTTGAKFIIPNANVDTSTITIKIQANSQSNVYDTFVATDSFIGIESADRVFWIKEIDDGLYELEFGNGVIGKALTNGNIVHIEYIVSDGPGANGAKLFRYVGNSLYQGDVSVSTVSQSSGSTAIESIESIKFNAPRLYSTQNRAVTVEDYRNLVYNLVSEAESVNVWSGADNSPPEYGKVFICIKPRTVEKFTTIEKTIIKNDIVKSKNMISVIPEIIDPEYIRVAVDVVIYYNSNSTVKSVNDMKLIVQNAISVYNAQELEKFGGILRFSKLSRFIDDADPAIVSNITNIVLHRAVAPKYDTFASYNVNLVNPIHPEQSGGSIISTGFKVLGSTDIHYLSDDGAGRIFMYILNNLTMQVVNSNVGTVDYGKGIIDITGINITTIEGTEWNFMIKPSSYDVVSVLNQLVMIPANLVTVNAISDLSLGASGGGAKYEFTSSRS